MVPEPEKFESVPPETVMSPTVKLVEASDNSNVTVMSWPPPTVPEPVRVMVTDGRFVFQAIDKFELAVLLLPTESVNLFAATDTDAVPEPDTGGVQVAV